MEYLTYYNDGVTYSEFHKLSNQFIEEQKYNDDLTEYTKLNLQRMKRWDKKGEVNKQIPILKNQKWLVITEPWCGDSAHSLPFIQKVAQDAGITLKIVLRDDHEELMNQFLTNNARSIPILIVFDDDSNLIYKWGPRPKEIQEWLIEAKRKNTSQEEIFNYLQKFYNKDAGNSVVREIFELMK